MVTTIYETEDGLQFRKPQDAARHENCLGKLRKSLDVLCKIRERGCLTRLTGVEQEEIDEFIAILEEFLS